MKIELTESHYADATGFKLIGAGVHDVDAKRARYLLKTFPAWFKAVDGEQSADQAPTQNNAESQTEPEAQAATNQENDEPEVPQNEPTASTPAKPVSKMNKDELVALAGEIGLEVNDEMSNKDLQAAIQAHQENQS